MSTLTLGLEDLTKVLTEYPYRIPMTPPPWWEKPNKEGTQCVLGTVGNMWGINDKGEGWG